MKYFLVAIVLFMLGWLFYYDISNAESGKHTYRGNVDDICYMPTAGTMVDLCLRN